VLLYTGARNLEVRVLTRRLDIREALLRSAKEEFLRCGYDKASLRNICKRANVTTGAIYNHFSCKEELFEALVKPMLSEFTDMYRKVMNNEKFDKGDRVENERISIHFAVKHKDEFKLLFECSNGTKYEGYREYMINKFFYPEYQEVFDLYAKRRVDPCLVRAILEMKFAEYMNFMRGDYEDEELEKMIVLLSHFSDGGVKQMIKVFNEKY